MSCAIYDVSEQVAHNTGISTEQANKIINELVNSGLVTKSDIEGYDLIRIIDLVNKKLDGKFDVDVAFEENKPVGSLSTEHFKGDISRSRRANAYIGANRAGAKYFKTKLKDAYSAAGKTVIDDGVEVNENTVAVVEITTESDIYKVAALCRKVLDAGGRVILPTQTEISTYAKTIKNDKVREQYENIHKMLDNALELAGASSRTVTEFDGRIIQKTENPVFEKLKFDSNSKVGKFASLNEGVDEKTIKAKAKPWNIKIGSTFTSKDGASTKADSVKSSDLYDAIAAGEVDSIAKRDTGNQTYSQLKQGDVLPLVHPQKGVLYVEVVDVQTGVSKDQYVNMLKNGEITTGFSAESASNMKDYGDTNIIKIKPLGKDTFEKAKSSGQKGTKSNKWGKGGGKKNASKGHWAYRKRHRYDKKNRVMRWWTEKVWVETAAEEKQVATVNDMVEAIVKALIKVGVKVEKLEPAANEEVAKDNLKSAQQKLAEAKKLNKEESVAAKEFGYASDVSTWFAGTHHFANNYRAKTDELLASFGGNRAVVDAMARGMASYFRRMAESKVIPAKIEMYKEEKERLEGLIEKRINEDGIASSNADISRMRRRVKNLGDKIQILETDGWLGAVRIGDVMSATLAQVTARLRDVYRCSEYIEGYMDSHKELSYDEAAPQAIMKYYKLNLHSLPFENLIKANVTRVPFVYRLLDGVFDVTDAEQAKIDEKNGDAAAIAARSERTEEQQNNIDEEDNKIKKRREDSRLLRRLMFEELAKKLSEAAQIKIDLRIIENKGKIDDEVGKLEYTVDYDLLDEELDQDESYYYEDSGRDSFMLNPDTVGISESLTNETRRILGSLYTQSVHTKFFDASKTSQDAAQKIIDGYKNKTHDIYVDRDSSGNVQKITHFVTDGDPFFGEGKMVPAGVARCNILDIFLNANEGRGFRTGDEFYDYIAKHEAETPWYHALKVEMEKKPEVRTRFFNAFRKANKPARSLLDAMKSGEFSEANKSFSKYISWAENYDEKAEWVLDKAQTQIGNGLILQRGDAGKTVRKAYIEHELTNGDKNVYQGDNIEFSNISIYDENGQWNEGSIEATDEETVGTNGKKNHIKNITRATGSYGFCLFVRSNLNKDYVQNSIKAFLSKERAEKGSCKEFDYMLTALHAIGIPCDRDALVETYVLHPEMWSKTVETIHRFTDASAISPMEFSASFNKTGLKTKYIFSHLSTMYKALSDSLTGLSRNSVDASYRWGTESRYSVQNMSFFQDLLSNISAMSVSGDEADAKRVDEEVKQYITDMFLQVDNGKYKNVDMSFFATRNPDDSIEILNPILRALMPSEDPKKNILSRKYRKMLSTYHWNLGISADRNADNTAYASLSAGQKISIDIMGHFSPATNRNEDLGHALEILEGEVSNSNDVLEDGSGYHGVCFAPVPIGAESNNHVHVAMPRRSTQWDKGGVVWRGLWIDAHRTGSLLDNCADVVMQEFNRIRVYASEYANGQKLTRPEMYKVFKKNELRYCNFVGLNNAFVSINGQELDFTRALEYLLTTSDSIDSDNIVVYTKNEKGEIDSAQHKVFSHEGVDLYRDVIMTAVHQLCLNNEFDIALSEWEDMGLFDVETDRYGNPIGYRYLQAQGGADNSTIGNSVFKDAYNNAKDKLYAGNALICQMLGVPVNSVYKGEVSLVKDANGQYAISRTMDYNGAEPAFTQLFYDLLNYENAEAGVKKGDVIEYILSMRDRNFGMDIIKAQVEDKNLLIEKYKNIAAFILEKSLNEISDSDQKDNITKAIKDSYSHRNLLMEAMQDFAFNKTINKAMLLQLFVGDLAQFKNEGDLSKRFKAVFAAYERCDLSARDSHNLDEHGEARMVKEWYGESRITDQKWQNNQKTITIADFECDRAKDGTDRSEGYVGLSQFFNEELLPKLQKDLRSGVISRQEYADFCDAYTKMNMTDGQSFRTIESMKKICDFLGLTTPGMNDIYDAVVKRGESLSWEQIRDFMQQMKTVSYGFQSTDVQYGGAKLSAEEMAAVKHYRQQFADFTKDSQFTLMMYSQMKKKFVERHADMVGGAMSIMCGIHKFCTENQVDVVHFMSTKKTGQFNVINLSQCRDADEAYKLLKDLAEKAALDKSGASDIFHAESWDNVGRQVAVHEHVEDVEQGIGTQIDKLIASDLEPFWQATEEYVDENGETRFRKTNPIKTTIALRDDDGKVLRRLDVDYFVELLNRVKITNMIEDYKSLETFLSDKQKFSEFLLDQLELTDKYADDVKNAVRLNDDGDFNLPLDTPQVIRAIAPVVASVIRKRIIKQKTKGGTAVQFSSVGRRSSLREVTAIDEESGQPYVQYIECMLPAWSKELFSAFADENGDVDLEKVPNHLKEMVGYRVPTEYMYSMVPLRVVGFLPKEAGGSIMLPQEITVWSGSDFDIDKMFLEMCEFETIKKGSVNEKKKAWREFYQSNPKIKSTLNSSWADAIQHDYDNEEDPERKLNLYSLLDYVKNHHITPEDFLSEGRSKLTQEELKDAFKTMSAAFADYRKEWSEKNKKGKGRLLDILGEEEYNYVLHSYQVFIEENGYWKEQVTTNGGEELLISSTQEEIEKASRMARNNLLVRLHFARLSSDHSFMKLNTPGGFSNVKKLSRIMKMLESGETIVNPATGRIMGFNDLMNASLSEIEPLADRYSKELNILNPASDDVMFQRNMSGKTSVGIYALHNSYHAVMQHAKTHLSEEFKKECPIILNGEQRDEIGSVRASDGTFIIRNIGSLLAASVDNAKDPVLGDLYLNSLTADYALTLLHLGYSLQTAVLFINQPIIKQLFKDFSRTAQPWYMFNKYYTGITKEIEFRPEVALNDSNMADAISSLAPQKLSVAELMKNEQQMNALAMLKHVMVATKAVKNMMDATKITSPKNNVANSYAESYIRRRPIRKSRHANTYYKNYKDKSSGIPIFNSEEYSGLVIDDENSNDFNIKTVEEYMKASRLPFVQASYDLGFKMPLYFLSRYIGSYSKDTDSCILKLNNKFTDTEANNLNEDIVKALVHERMIFMTNNALVFENREWNDTGLQKRNVSEARRAFLTSFPRYFTETIQAYRKYGAINEEIAKRNGNKPIDLQKKYAILDHIVSEPNKNKSYNLERIPAFLKFTKNGGKADKNIQNEITDSWANLYYSEDPVLQDLSINLLLYSMFYNGCDFSPVTFGQYCPMCVISEFPSYTETLRHDFVNGMTDAMQERFVHQFIMNHTNEMKKRGLIKVYETKENEVQWILKDVAEYKETEKEIPDSKGGTKTIKEKKLVLKNKTFTCLDTYNIAKNRYVCFVLDSKNYNEKGLIFRRSELADATGHYTYEYVEPLGDGSFVDYDNTRDVVEHVPLGLLGYDTIVKRKGDSDAAQAKSELLAKRRQKQLDELAKLTEMVNRVGDDRQSDSHNDSEHYILDKGTANEVKGLRVHDFAQKYLKVNEHSTPPTYGFSGTVTAYDSNGKRIKKEVKSNDPIMSQKEWDSLGKIGTSIGSCIDRFFRLYVKKLDDKVGLTPEEQSEYDNFCGPDGFCAQNKIDMSKFSMPLSEGQVAARGKTLDMMSPLERLEVLADMMVRRMDLQGQIEENGKVVRYADRLITEIDGKPIRLFSTVTINGEQVPLGGELDFIIMRGDGTWEIGDWKTMNRLCALTMLDESLNENGMDSAAKLYRYKHPETDDDRAERGKYLGYVERYSEYKKYLNTYRALLLNVIPGIEVPRLFLSNITVERISNTDKDSAEVTRMEFTDINQYNNGRWTLCSTPEVKIDEGLIGIQIPHPTTTQEESQEEEAELDDKANGVSEETSESESDESTSQSESAPTSTRNITHTGPYSDGYSSYEEILKKFIGEDAVKSPVIQEIVDAVDRFDSIESTKSYKERVTELEYSDEEAKEEISDLRDTYLNKPKRIINQINLLSGFKVDDQVATRVIEAISNHKKIVDDTNTPICK